MAKERRMDWYKKFPRDISSSWDYQRMNSSQRGAYNDLLDGCWLNFEKGCGIQLEPEWIALAWKNGEWDEDGLEFVEPLIAHITTIHDPEKWKKEMPSVLKKFKVLGGLLVNEKLLSQVDETLVVATNASIRGSGKAPGEPEPSSSLAPESSSKASRGEKIREEESKAAQPSSFCLDDEMLRGGGEVSSIRPKGTFGHFARGQYPGTSPKAIFSHIAKAWARVRGVAAVCRYPSKYPANWELLCDSHSGDILVPAFELWAVKNGYNTEWPLTEFIKVAQEYMALVIPLKENKPALTQETIEKTNVQANEVHESVWAVKTEPEKGAAIEDF